MFSMAIHLFCIGLTSLGYGQFLDNVQDLLPVNPQTSNPEPPTHHFIRPNETNPADAKAIWEQAPSGPYVSVGSERGFIGAFLSPGVDHLLLIMIPMWWPIIG